MVKTVFCIRFAFDSLGRELNLRAKIENDLARNINLAQAWVNSTITNDDIGNKWYQ